MTKGVKTTGGKIVEKYLGIGITIGKKPCGHVGIIGIDFLPIAKARHDPEMN